MAKSSEKTDPPEDNEPLPAYGPDPLFINQRVRTVDCSCRKDPRCPWCNGLGKISRAVAKIKKEKEGKVQREHTD